LALTGDISGGFGQKVDSLTVPLFDVPRDCVTGLSCKPMHPPLGLHDDLPGTPAVAVARAIACQTLSSAERRVHSRIRRPLGRHALCKE